MTDPKTPERTKPVDAGKTSGGGSSGHDQPEDVSAQTKIRNQSGVRGKTGGQRDTPDTIPEPERLSAVKTRQKHCPRTMHSVAGGSAP